MNDSSWLSMASAPKDGSDIVVTTHERSVMIFIRWDGQRWMNGSTPINAEGLAGLAWKPLTSRTG